MHGPSGPAASGVRVHPMDLPLSVALTIGFSESGEMAASSTRERSPRSCLGACAGSLHQRLLDLKG